MKKILSILKKYIPAIILIIVLLVLQAYCDLSLPDYTSNIINVGIQEKGIESSVPEKISKESMDKILIFTDDKSDEKILSNYNLNGNNYELKQISKEETEELENIISMPEVIVYTLKNMDMNTLMQNMNKDSENKENVDYSKFANIPEGTDIFKVLSMLDENALQEIVKDFEEKYNDLGKSMVKQTAIAYLQEEYQNIGIDLKEKQLGYIKNIGLKMVGIAALAMAITILTTFIASKVSAGFGYELREKVIRKTMNFANKEFEEFSTSSLITRSTNDIQQVQILLIMVLRMVLYAPIIGIGALTKIAGNSMQWIIGVTILTIIGFMILLLVMVMPKFQKIQKLIDKLNMVSREILTGLPVIRAFDTAKYEEKRFDNANVELTEAQLFTRKVMALLMPFLTLIMNGVCILIVWVASKKIDLGGMQVGDMTAMLTYTMQIIMAFLMLSMLSIMAPRAMVSFKRIAEVLNKENSIKEKEESEQAKFDESKKGLVEFKNVSFRYPDAEEDTIKNISFETKPGTITAIIGATGSGKSTLVNLIPRLYDVTDGEILIEGVNIKDVGIHDLRGKIGFVPQKGLLFSGTIESNIKFGEENLSDEEMEKAARVSQAKEFIENKEEKYKAGITQGGSNVSGGQKQRLAIARALATNANIYVFDDSFSALDYKTDSLVRKGLSKEMKGATMFIVAQRISTIMNADQILVLEDGKIVGKGKHKELLENCDVYREIANSQLSKKELEG